MACTCLLCFQFPVMLTLLKLKPEVSPLGPHAQQEADSKPLLPQLAQPMPSTGTHTERLVPTDPAGEQKAVSVVVEPASAPTPSSPQQPVNDSDPPAPLEPVQQWCNNSTFL